MCWDSLKDDDRECLVSQVKYFICILSFDPNIDHVRHIYCKLYKIRKQRHKELK